MVPPEFYNQMIPTDIFNKVASNLLIHKVSIKIKKRLKKNKSVRRPTPVADSRVSLIIIRGYLQVMLNAFQSRR